MDIEKIKFITLLSHLEHSKNNVVINNEECDVLLQEWNQERMKLRGLRDALKKSKK